VPLEVPETCATTWNHCIALVLPLHHAEDLLVPNKVAMLFSSGKKVAPKGKAAPKKAAAKPKAKPAPRKAAPKKVAPKKLSSSGPNLQPSPSAIEGLKELFSLSLVGGAQGNTLR
jgi:hypothetical protein